MDEVDGFFNVLILGVAGFLASCDFKGIRGPKFVISSPNFRLSPEQIFNLTLFSILTVKKDSKSFDYLYLSNIIDSNVGKVRQETVKILHAYKRFLLDASHHS